jgi:hypothetical protein
LKDQNQHEPFWYCEVPKLSKGVLAFPMPKKKQVPPTQPEIRVPAMQSEVIPPTQAETKPNSTEPKREGEAVEQWEELFRFLSFRVMALKQDQAQARPMQSETKKQMFDAFLKLFTFQGFPPLPSAREKLLEMLNTEGHTDEELAHSALLTGMLAALVLLMERNLDTYEEPTPEELEKTITGLENLRYQMRGMFKKSTAAVVKAMPRDPGGHPRRFTKEQSAQVCHEIAEMNERGILKSNAFRLLAKKYKTSYRTVQRTWQERPR